VKNIKQLIQDDADNRKAIATLKKEGRALNAIPATAIAATATTAEVKARTPEQVARFTAVFAELDALEEKQDTLAAELVIARRLQEDERALGAAIPAVTVGVDHATEQPVTLGEIMQAMAYEAPEMPAHRKATILPRGVAPHVAAALHNPELQAAAAGASSGVPESGGVLVRNEWNTSLMTRMQESGNLAGRCFPMPVGEGFDGVEAPYVDETSRATGSRWGGVQVYRAAEAAAATATAPKLGKFELRLEDLLGLFYATDRVLRDATLLESLAMKAFASEFAFKLDDEIVRGTGAGQCLGIIGNAPTVSVAKEGGQTAGTFVFENVIKMYSVLLARCMPGAEWFINQTVLPQLFKMYLAVGTGGVPVYLPANGASATPYGTLMGLPVNVIEQAAAVGTVGDVILANLHNDYALAQKPMTNASSIHVLFTSNQTTFRWVWPVIGKPVLASAITPYKGSATFGPFVTVATRA
jgi:HK97 family phage major capsid protein